ncbi:FitA-like ribbon-helix-helix domain-containing protein [Microbacterium album]|uniref:Antitoxin FitA-like ribbon-helix-helix domain-containing protein n=1 Tax=Microbacterium album TaxID=2053191 RepID=A0A917IF63_9MICO|nr:plasmid stabilization protein [Microbacterium album]GGH43740.1 hypothetical protein GCM10010921_17920 [Microbacterium album]
MAAITIRSLPDEVHRALKAQAQRHGRSTEAEVRSILSSAVLPQQRVRMGQAMSQIGRRARLADEEAALLDDMRDRTPAEPIELP